MTDSSPNSEYEEIIERFMREFEAAMSNTLAAIKRLAEQGVR